MARATKPEGPDPRLLDQLRTFQAQVRELGRSSGEIRVTPGTPSASLSDHEIDVVRRVRVLSPDVAESLEQSLTDVADIGRKTYVGPAGEAREVMRAVIHRLVPDGEVKAEAWFKGEGGNPTQAERVRHAAERRGAASADPAVEASGLVEERLGRLGRSVYQRASKALHAGTQRAEARKIINAVVLVLDDVLPD